MIELRVVEPKDLDDIMELERTCFPKSVRAPRSTISYYLRSPSIDIIVAEDVKYFAGHRVVNGSKVVGCVIIFYRSNSQKAYIDSLAVLPKYRRQGIGKQLKDMATLYAYARGIKQLHSDVAKTNHKMLNLNHSLGWKVVGEKRDYYGKGKHAYHMLKE